MIWNSNDSTIEQRNEWVKESLEKNKDFLRDAGEFYKSALSNDGKIFYLFRKTKKVKTPKHNTDQTIMEQVKNQKGPVYEMILKEVRKKEKERERNWKLYRKYRRELGLDE